EARPQMEYSLGELDLIEREKKFIESFFSVIKNIRNPNNLSKAINNVKVSYAKLGILPEHYPIVGKTLLKSLKFYLGPGWTPQVESAWTAFFDSAMKQFLQPVAKAKTQPATPPATQSTTQPKNPNPPQSSDLDTDRFDRGEEKLNQVFNTAADRFTKSLKDIAPDLSRYIIEYGFGEIYSRPGLDLKSRQIAAISALVVQGNCESQLMDNIHGA
ncbi:globin domain-containing protein, partial [Anaplasma marginale]|uniref:globin domain-containing protein n=1 Tax=Anaplasma marginale TaxID=770 RepID=UPI0018E9B9E3